MHPQHPQPAPTAWQSIPTFIRFMVWLMAILGFVWMIVLPILAVIATVGGGIAASS